MQTVKYTQKILKVKPPVFILSWNIILADFCKICFHLTRISKYGVAISIYYLPASFFACYNIVQAWQKMAIHTSSICVA